MGDSRMKLKEYLEKNRIDPVEFCVTVDIGISTVYRIMRGCPCNRNTAIRVERATKGIVTVEEMMGTDK